MSFCMTICLALLPDIFMFSWASNDWACSSDTSFFWASVNSWLPGWASVVPVNIALWLSATRSYFFFSFINRHTNISTLTMLKMFCLLNSHWKVTWCLRSIYGHKGLYSCCLLCTDHGQWWHNSGLLHWNFNKWWVLRDGEGTDLFFF